MEELIQINIEEQHIRQLLSLGISGKAKFFIMNSNKNSFQPLTAGQIQIIQSHHPQKVLLSLEDTKLALNKGSLCDISHKQYIGYQDLWVFETFYNSCLKQLKIKTKNTTIQKEKQTTTKTLAIDLKEIISKSQTLQNLLSFCDKAITNYPAWKEKNPKVRKTGNLYNWVIDSGANDREAHFVVKVLSEKFNDLK